MLSPQAGCGFDPEHAKRLAEGTLIPVIHIATAQLYYASPEEFAALDPQAYRRVPQRR